MSSKLLDAKYISFFAVLIVATLGMHNTTDAALLAYEPFLAGGSAPDNASGEYATGTGFTGSPSDNINGQGPTVSGFVAPPWATAGSYANFVYYRTEADQLIYADSGFRRLDTSGGQLNLFRSSGTNSDPKTVARDLAIGAPLPGSLYISALVQVTTGNSLTIQSASTDGGTPRLFDFGINASGNPFVTGTDTATGSDTDTNTGIVIDPSVPHLLVAKLTNDGFDSDQIDLYLDPQLDSELSNVPVATIDGGNFYVGGNPNWTLENIFLNNIIPVPGSIVVDEIRIGGTFAEVTPFTIVVPEPSAWTLGCVSLLALAGLVWRRRR